MNITYDSYLEEIEKNKLLSAFQPLKEKGKDYHFKDITLRYKGSIEDQTLEFYISIEIKENLDFTNTVQYKRLLNYIEDIKMNNDLDITALNVDYGNAYDVWLPINSINNVSDIRTIAKKENKGLYAKYKFEKNCLPNINSPYKYEVADDKGILFQTNELEPQVDETQYQNILDLILQLQQCETSANNLNIIFKSEGNSIVNNNYISISDYFIYDNKSLEQLIFDIELLEYH